jgi:archaellin
MTKQNYHFIVCLIGLFFICLQPAFAAGKVDTIVKVIHASTGSSHVDPQLKDISNELDSVFKYTSYRMLSEKQMQLEFNQDGNVSLPGGRTLIVTPADMQKNRIRYHINILKNNKSIFKTQVLLRNNNSITIGGPQYKNGVLLFHITGRAD